MGESVGLERVREQLAKWRQEVINLARSNRLLYFRHLKTSTLEIVSPLPAELLRGLDGLGWDIYFPPEPSEPEIGADSDQGELLAEPRPPGPNELVTDKTTGRQLHNSLTALARRTEQEFMDKGLWVLYLGVGMLTWRDEDDHEAQSPLLLMPVQLSRGSPREPYRLIRAEEDETVNPALVVKLAEFGIELPQIDVTDQVGITGFLAEAGQAVATRTGWSVEPRVVMGVFSFQKEVMYRDLLNNEEEIVHHELVSALALGSAGSASSDLDFEPLLEELLDEQAPPEEMATIRDADASQRQCIVAARDGHSFVMDGPPGTGKSQTIANMIAELLLADKTVLFVSEKAAALEVVQKRLQECGLDDFALELHSHKATRKEVATALAQPLLRRPTPGPPLSSTDRSRLVDRRRRLSAHAAAMNEVRQPLGLSLHQALGRVTQLTEAPEIALPKIDESLSAASLAEVLDAARSLSRAWGPVARGDEFLWREPSERATDPARRSEILELLHSAGRSLTAVRSAAQDAAEELDLPWARSTADARRLATLLGCLASPLRSEREWLIGEELEPAVARAKALAILAAEHEHASGELGTAVGARGLEIDPAARDALGEACLTCENLLGEAPPVEMLAADLARQIDLLEAASSRFTGIDTEAQRIAVELEQSASGLTLNEAGRLAEAIQLIDQEPTLEAGWLTRPGAVKARQALEALRPAVSEWSEQRDQLTEVFSDDVLDTDLEGLKARFETVHKGLSKLKGGYRDDKRVLAAVTRAKRVDDGVVARLGDALEWKRTTARLAELEARVAGALGDAYRRDQTDFAAMEEMLTRAERLVELTDGRGLTPEAAARVAHGALDPGLAASARSITRDLEAWDRDAVAGLATVRGALESQDLNAAAMTCASAETALRSVHGRVAEISALAGRELSLEEVSRASALRAKLAEIDSRVDSASEADRRLLGPAYRGLLTDWPTLSARIDWAARVRETFGRALTEREVDGLEKAAPPAENLAALNEAWNDAAASVETLFEPARRADVRAELTGVFEDASQYLDALERTVGDIDVWLAYQRSFRELEVHGLTKGLAQLIKRRTPADQVPGSIERACLRGWIESVMKRDRDRLEPDMLSSDRDQLLAEFRRLDRELVERKANEVIARCNERRPRGTAGPAGIIIKESEKKSRHMPVRKLLADTGDFPLLLKPCFLMSPLTVSQFLPPGLRFDAVIFDEASQVRPADAINCVYRGDQLIVAGDQRQLPPTSFFERFTQEDGDEYVEDQLEEFDSILDLCKGSGALRALSLRWHYRSRHESLITYSNYSFYDGRLISFPGAAESGGDVGVELFAVDGVYRRGGARDNPIEAAAVAERVLHHAVAHPERTLGVVAFSEAQASAIEAEIDRRRLELPGLDSFFDADRLDGFFVKNLENVQGDERDIIIFSIGYGRDETGKLTMNFGPVSNAGGHRRLNVAITRARQRVEVVSSITAADMRHDAAGEGARHLRRYLDFAERGIDALSIEIADAGRDTESPFEDEVLRVVRSWGYDAVPQLGSAGYRIDLAVRHPNRPGRFMLGIECDGAMYHSSRVARDRDRLRQEVLENLGWRIHRIWGTSWYRDRPGQEARLREALEAATRDDPKPRRPKPVERPREVVHEILEIGGAPDWTQPYRVSEPRLATYLDMHEPAARSELKRMISEVVAVEAPVSEEVCLRRVREAWGVGRAGHRIRDAFEQAIKDLARRGGVRRDDEGFLWTEPPPPPCVRTRTADDDRTSRDVSEIPSVELALAVLNVVRDARRIDREELSVNVARLFGWARRGNGITRALDGVAERLLQEGMIVDSGAGWLAPSDAVTKTS